MTTSPQPHPNHDRGLEFDLSTLMSRRSLGIFLGAGTAAAALAACTPGSPTTAAPGSSAGSGSASGSAGSPTTTARATSGAGSSAGASPTLTRAIAECGVEIPAETAGPFPGDGSNGPNALEASGVVRQDIRSSFGTSSGKADGIPLTLTLTLVDGSTRNGSSCLPLAGAAVYAWHCDREGRYSMYDPGVEDVNYLRGVQEADADGNVTFQTIFPGAYSGRWPHIHFEVFESLNNATAAGQVLAVSQVALTDAACRDVYGSPGYETSAKNFPRTTLKADNVFRNDGGIYQLAAMSGSASGGYTATLNVTV